MFKLITPARFAACLVYAFNPRGNYDCRNTLEIAIDECSIADEQEVLDAIDELSEGMSALLVARR